MMETVQKILEVIKWPLVVVVIGIVAIVCFRQCIAAFINRAKWFKYPGGEIQAGPPPQDPAEIKVGSAEKSLQALNSPVLLDTENAIKEILAKDGLATVEDREKVLIRHLAISQLNLAFSHIDFLIYHSQLKIIEALNSNPAPKQMARDVYNAAVAFYPEVLRNYPFEKYLGFLKTNNLILEHEDTLSITLFGREFLAFLVRMARNAVYRVG